MYKFLVINKRVPFLQVMLGFKKWNNLIMWLKKISWLKNVRDSVELKISELPEAVFSDKSSCDKVEYS